MDQKIASDDRPYMKEVGEDRPYIRPDQSVLPWVFLMIAAAVAAGAGWYFYVYLPEQQPKAPVPAPVAQAPRPEPVPSAQPAVRHPLPEPEAARALPPLDKSDSFLRDLLSDLVGRRDFETYFVQERIVPRIVSAVDNLPRKIVPPRASPLNPPKGAFVVTGTGEQAVMAPANAARYVPYVVMTELLPVSATVTLYVRTYPLFQRAYEELGYGGKYFNDRVIETIDDLIAAPEVSGPIKLNQRKVLYEFADEELEARSAGQKLMIRMGTENSRKVKEKLKGLKAEIIAASTKK